MSAVAHGQRGYALVAAVAGLIFFATIALGVLAVTQRALVTGSADVEAARVAVAAEAGVVLAIDQLLNPSLAGAWSNDGRLHRADFDGVQLEIAIVDERGKVPLNLLDEKQIEALLEYAGLSGERLTIARDSYLDWIDDDDEPRSDGAEIDYYRKQGIRPRNGALTSLGELGRVRGFSPDVVSRIASIGTVDFGSGSFETRFAKPAAIRIMYVNDSGSVAEIERAREAAGQVTALAFSQDSKLVARPLLVAVTARIATGAMARRACVIELTGTAGRPFVLRHCD